jgi:hypothetical protein
MPAAYTAILGGKNRATGTGLVELYDLGATSNSRLANISTRGFVSTGDNQLIGGVILEGAVPRSIVVRGLGPSLATAGVSNALQDPILELRDGNGTLLMTNDNWTDNPAQAAIIFAYGLAPPAGAESALVLELPAGTYTALLRGKNATAGIGLIEFYNPSAATDLSAER